jgi:hypothetical protein
VRCRWDLVSVIVLLCQGMIFENDEEVQQTAVFFFGVTSAVILVAAITASVLNTMKSVLKSSTTRSVVLSKAQVNALDDAMKHDLLRLFSEEEVEQNGNIHIQRENLNRISPVQVAEILTITEKQFEHGQGEFDKIAAEIRSHLGTTQNFRLKH